MNAGDTFITNCAWILASLFVLFLVGRWLVLRADNSGQQGLGEYTDLGNRKPYLGNRKPYLGNRQPYPPIHFRGPSAAFDASKLADQRRNGRHLGGPIIAHIERRWARHPNDGGDFDTWNNAEWLERNGPANNVFIEWE